MDDPTTHAGTGRTFVLIKPDGVQRRLIGEIIGRYEKAGLRVTALRMLGADATVIAQHYPNSMAEGLGLKTMRAGQPIDDPIHHGQKVLGWLRTYLTSGPLVAMILEGEDAIARARVITGYTDPAEADNGTIRGDLGEDSIPRSTREHRPVRNLVHASGNVHEAEREIELWFPRERVP
jgi:nucleoside-diphosphate kinase